MAETLEYKTVVSCFNKLVTALKQDPVAVANELVSESLIPPVDGSIDVQKLAQLLLDKIQLSPKRYYDIVKVFSRLDWLADIVDILQSEHGKIGSDSVELQQSPNSVCTESMRKLSISSGESPKPAAEGEATSDDGFKLELDCPHQQSSLPIPNPVVRFKDLSKSDRKDLFAQMNELTKEIRVKFSKLFDQVYESLSKHFEHKRVVLTLTREGVQLFQGNKKLLRAKNMFDVFNVIQPHCSYFNYDLLMLLVGVHGTPEDKKCLDGYLKSFASYCRAMPCAEEICGSDSSGTDRIKLKFKLEFDRQQLKPNYIKDNIISNIARILNIKPSSLYLHRIKEGCVCLEFLIPSFLFDGLFPLSDEQMVALYTEVNVTSIQCDQPSLHMDIENYKALSEERQVESTSDVPSPGYSGLHPQGWSQSLAVGLETSQQPDQRRTASEAPDYHQQPYALLRVKTDSTTSSEASSGYCSSQGSSEYLNSGTSGEYGHRTRVIERPERFDHKRLMKVWERDPEWKQLGEEWRQHESERHRLDKEVEQLRREKYDAKDKKDIELKLKIKQLERQLANSKYLKAFHQQDQRVCELKRNVFMQELKTATNNAMKSEIQRRLERAEREIRQWKEMVSKTERKVSEHEEILSQLWKGEEGRQTDTVVLKTKSSILSPPTAPSPVTTLYTCPSCGKQYRSDKSLQHSGEERCVSCSH